MSVEAALIRRWNGISAASPNTGHACRSSRRTAGVANQCLGALLLPTLVATSPTHNLFFTQRKLLRTR